MSDEILDIFNEIWEKIGEAHIEEVHTKGLLHQTCSLMLFKDETKKEILIQQRSSIMRTFPFKWQNAAGGHIEVGNTIHKGMWKEIQEELFAHGRVPSFSLRKLSVFYHQDSSTNKEIMHLFEGIYPGPFDIGDELETIEWISWEKLLDELKKNSDKYTPIMHAIIEKYKKENYDILKKTSQSSLLSLTQ
ncbi:NUDIX domain-containing protein [Candidatus Woesearchaeota archaeon]|nr:NUDIX domain-containing protein [Candidatus Woesearchaeota archaeon]